MPTSGRTSEISRSGRAPPLRDGGRVDRRVLVSLPAVIAIRQREDRTSSGFDLQPAFEGGGRPQLSPTLRSFYPLQ
jgi:hypothetical protein